MRLFFFYIAPCFGDYIGSPLLNHRRPLKDDNKIRSRRDDDAPLSRMFAAFCRAAGARCLVLCFLCDVVTHVKITAADSAGVKKKKQKQN